jgi:hypothetical protein
MRVCAEIIISNKEEINEKQLYKQMQFNYINSFQSIASRPSIILLLTSPPPVGAFKLILQVDCIKNKQQQQQQQQLQVSEQLK